jgi:hypothetical protein
VRPTPSTFTSDSGSSPDRQGDPDRGQKHYHSPLYPCLQITGATITRNRQPPDLACQETKVTFCVQGVISLILANLFLHYAFDIWMTRTFPAIPFEGYADDCICYCRSEEEARALLKPWRLALRPAGWFCTHRR